MQPSHIASVSGVVASTCGDALVDGRALRDDQPVAANTRRRIRRRVPSTGTPAGYPGPRAAGMLGMDDGLGWVGVRCVFRMKVDEDQVFEERVTLWRAATLDAAIARAESEAQEYAATIGADYLGLAQAYLLFGGPDDGAEVFSLMRSSPLPAEVYLSTYFDTGTERQQQA